MKIQLTLTSTKMKNISNFLKQPRMWTGFYKTLCWQAVKKSCLKKPLSSLMRCRTALRSLILWSIFVRMHRSITLPVPVLYWVLPWRSLPLFPWVRLTLCRLTRWPLMNSYLPTVMKIWRSIWNRWIPLTPSLTLFLIRCMKSWKCTMSPVVCRSRYWCGRRQGMFLPCRKHCPESSEPMSVILQNILTSASSRKSQWSGNPFLLNWQKRTRSSSIKWSRKEHEPVSTRMPCNGW